MGDFIDDTYRKRYQPFGDDTLEKSLWNTAGSCWYNRCFFNAPAFRSLYCATQRQRQWQTNAAFSERHTLVFAYTMEISHESKRKRESIIPKRIFAGNLHSGKLKFVENEELGMKNMEIEFVFWSHRIHDAVPYLQQTNYFLLCSILIPSHHYKVAIHHGIRHPTNGYLTGKDDFLEKHTRTIISYSFEHDKDVECCTWSAHRKRHRIWSVDDVVRDLRG